MPETSPPPNPSPQVRGVDKTVGFDKQAALAPLSGACRERSVAGEVPGVRFLLERCRV